MIDDCCGSGRLVFYGSFLRPAEFGERLRAMSGSLLPWFSLPPVVAVLTALIVGAMGSSDTGTVDASLWGLVGLVFIVLTVLYSLFIRRRFYSGLIPVQLVAQGILICPLALRFGAQMLQWVGVLMTVCGSIILLLLFYEDRFPGALSAQKEKNNLPLPFAITDRTGRILSISDSLLALLDMSRDVALRGNITSCLRVKEGTRDTVVLKDRTWRITQRSMKGNSLYFQLDEKTASSGGAGAGADAFTDFTTKFHTLEYALQRLDEELHRVQRYRCRLAVLLLHVTFPDTPKIGEAEMEGFRAYCQTIQSRLRKTDIACLLASCNILIIAPEATKDMPDRLLNKLLDILPSIRRAFPAFGPSVVLDTSMFIEAETGVHSARGLLNQLDTEIRIKYHLPPR